MKVAIVHDYIKEYGGAERVLESLHNAFPEAPIYTLVYDPKFLGPHRERFERMKIKPSLADTLPFKSKLISPLRLVAPILFKTLNLTKYDVVIVSATGAYNPNFVMTKTDGKGAVHISYTHTPPRYLYGYETAREWKKDPVLRILGTAAFNLLRIADFKSSQNVDYFIANSEETKRRINKFYKKEAAVIYPPVDLKMAKPTSKKETFYITGGRISRAKHTDLIVDAFIKNKKPLKIFGRGFAGFEEEIKQKIEGISNIEFLGEVDDKKKNVLLAKAKAFISASEDEDFGIMIVEALADGTPVISHRSGGPMETIKEGKTGLFFDELSESSLNLAISKFEKSKIKSSDCAASADKYSKDRFEKEIKAFIERKSDARTTRS